MKILHIVLTSSFAGTEQHVCVLANEQVRNGHVVEVWGGDPETMRERLEPAITHRAYATVAAALRARVVPQADVVNAHMTKAELAAALGRRSGAPVIATRHFAAVRGQSPGGQIVRPIIRNSVSRQIAVSDFVASRIDGDSVVVYAGVAPQPRVTAPRERTILVAQRLAAEKGTADALEAFAASRLPQRGWHMQIAGDGDDREILTRRAGKLELADSVTFLGFTRDVQTQMRQASIVLATAPAEPFGLTVVEAMAHGTPVVATAGGGHLESVGRASSAYLYPPGDPATAGSLLKVLADDEQRRIEYGAALRETQRSWFTPDRQYKETQRVYEEVLRL